MSVHVSSFFAFSFWASLVEKFMAWAIQVSVRGARLSWVVSFSGANLHMFGSITSSSKVRYWVQFRGSFRFGSSCIWVCCIRLSSDHLFCISTILLVAAVNFWFIVCHGMKILLVFQSIVGLCSFNQGSPKRTSLFPVFVMRNLVRSCWSSKTIWAQVQWVILPDWLVVPSTFHGIISFKRGIVRIWFFLTKV